MYFSSLSELIAMDGHGMFVWLSYGTALVVLLVNFSATRFAIRRQENALRWRAQAAAMHTQHSNGDRERRGL
jgi:heme exporter protein CcmD|tara:strand:- start:139 stop:354 length:216 start_codon:yes stop_codon:yes gene_type:complete